MTRRGEIAFILDKKYVIIYQKYIGGRNFEFRQF